MSFICVIINLLNLIICFYLIGPAIDITLISFLCENNYHKYLFVKCFSDISHIKFIKLSLLILILYIFISFLYSFYCNNIGVINRIFNDNSIRINSNYEIFCLITKIIIFVFGFFIKRNENNFILKIIYESYAVINCLIMTFYINKNVYYYNNILNNLNHYGWFITTWFSFCILIKTIFKIKNTSIMNIIGFLIIILLVNKKYEYNEYSLITEINVFEFKNNKMIEIYINILLKHLCNKRNITSKIFLYGMIKKFEEYFNNNPELLYNYQKLINDNNLIVKFNKEELKVVSIIFTLYSYYIKNLLNEKEIIFHMCYFLINKLNNYTYAMLLCSKLKTTQHKYLYYKYLLSEDIKEYLIFKLNKRKKGQTIKHAQIGSVILYNLYNNLFKIKIYDAICNQIDYFDLIKNYIEKNKITENFIELGKNILKLREDIIFIYNNLIELNPFNDDYKRDFILYSNEIIQDEYLAKEESKKFIILKNNNKSNMEKSFYYNLFSIDKSAILLVDGYLSNGKILYSSENFPYIFSFQQKELLNFTIEDLLPNCIKIFHKELVDNAIKYSKLKYIFKKQRETLLKNKNDELISIKLFVNPVPNLSYGLTYYTFLEKIKEANFIIILNKDLKINGFTDVSHSDSYFVLENILNLNNNILGSHIGLIIPDILFLLEYKNEEFNITKNDCELKGHLYPINNVKDFQNKIDIILDKVKTNKMTDDYKTQFIEKENNIINSEFNELIKELNNKNIKPLNIFYKIKKYSFIEEKYKYYRIYIKFDLISENYNENNNINYINNNKNKLNQIKKNIHLFEKNNEDDINKIKSILIKKEEINHNEDYFEDNKKSFKIKKNKLNKINSNLLDTESKMNIIRFNKIKYQILDKKEIYPLIIMKKLYYISITLIIILIILDLLLQKSEFNKLAIFSEQNLFFNQTKIILGIIYTLSVNIRWLSHSLYINIVNCPTSNWARFYQVGISEKIKSLQGQKNKTKLLDKNFKDILNQRYENEIYVYKFKKTEIYKFNFDNLLSYIINCGIKLMDHYSYFNSSSCKEIPKELGLNEINLKNLIELTYFLYNSNIKGYIGKEKTKKINENFSQFPIILIFATIIIISILLFYIYYIIYLHNIELIFLDKLVNFTSPNFDNYNKELNEIKKNLKNDNNKEDDKEDDINSNYLENIKENEQNDSIEKDKYLKNHKKRMNIGSKNKLNKIKEQKKKKLKIMINFFRKNNLFFGIKIILIMIISLIYFLFSLLLKIKYKNNYLEFDNINNSFDIIIKDSFDIFISLKRELDFYERNLINCSTLGKFEKMKIPKITEIKSPIIGNLLMNIESDSDFTEKTINEFNLIFNGNICQGTTIGEKEFNYCINFWNGILLKGIHQAITYLGVVSGNVIDELESLNDISNNKTIINLMNDSLSFFSYQSFYEYYLSRAYSQIVSIFNNLRTEKINSIYKKIKLFTIIYIIIIIFFYIILYSFTFSFVKIFNSFINFIAILPQKYFFEDEKFYKVIINFGNNY